MKYCPYCQITYTDDSLQFCFDDGANLLDFSVKNSQMPTQAFGEMETMVRQNNIPTVWGQNQVTQLAMVQPIVKKSKLPQTVILTTLMMCILFGVGLGMWLLISSNSDTKTGNTNNSSFLIPTNIKTPEININQREKSNKTNSIVNKRNGTGWKPTDNNASLQGTNLTYYRGTTAEQCKADCDKNPKCKAFTLIRAGAYNPNDPPMCYLASEVTGSVPSTCCISAIKSDSNENSVNKETLKACNYFFGTSIYEKWKQMGGENGVLGCPMMNEIEAEPSPQGTKGRMTQFSKGDGGYIIWHETGNFSGTAFEVSGCMFKIYHSLGATKSWLGFPIKDGFTTSGGARQDFEDGYILWDSKTYNCEAHRY